MQTAKCRPQRDQATDSTAPGKAGEKEETLNVNWVRARVVGSEVFIWWWLG